MGRINSKEIRQKYLDFFESKGHKIIPSASLVPPDTDPTVLFNTAGMQPLVPYLLGEKHSKGDKLADSQKCIRTVDIDEVGDASHLTFFEMLGNWSLGSYFKKEAIEYSWEFLTSVDWLGLDKNRLAVSIFKGNDDASFDEESFNLWKELGVPEARIAKLGKEDNWWETSGTGPCGPDTEMFYWTSENEVPEKFDPEDDTWIEIWNDVFMEYNKTSNGEYKSLAQKNVDTGMGLERIVMVVQDKDNVYETDLFAPIIEKIKGLATIVYEEAPNSYRVVADHIKAATFIISAGVEPSNTDKGYILRRLIRRAIRQGKLVGIESNFIVSVAEEVLKIYEGVYPELEENKAKIVDVLVVEEDRFGQTLGKGIKELNKISLEEVNGEKLFYIFSTYGFPLELSLEELFRRDRSFLNSDLNKLSNEFAQAFKKHQELSQTSSAGMFKGGLADAGEQTTKYHTATHLLLAAIREVLGEETYQKGSNITAERMRFDFNYPEKLTDEQKQKIEDLVNEKIKEDIFVELEEMPKEEALKLAKVSFDPSKYGDTVKVYKIGDFSIELCGGPHVKSTGELGIFKIKKESSSSAGVRRIKAVLE